MGFQYRLLENLYNAPFSLLQRLTSLFNYKMSHAFVQKQFRSGFMIPIIKENQGSHKRCWKLKGDYDIPCHFKDLRTCFEKSVLGASSHFISLALRRKIWTV